MSDSFGLYLVLTEPVAGYARCAEAAVRAGVRYVQLRMKRQPRETILETARTMASITWGSPTRFILNDDPALAAESEADGVHLGEHDGGITSARALLGDGAIIGVSCYDDIERARMLAAQGADYIAFGAFFPSPTKPNARRASPALLRDSADLGIPRVAIGGITPDNARPLVEAGADLIAVISGIFDAPDPVATARAYLSTFQNDGNA